MKPRVTAAPVRRAEPAARKPSSHPASWWAQLSDATDRFDVASATEGLGDEIIPKISSRLLRREAEIAAEVVVRHLNKPSSDELAGRAVKAIDRLVATVERLDQSETAQAGLTEAHALCHALQGRYADAAAEAEHFVGTTPLLTVFLQALRLEQFDTSLAVRLIRGGHEPGAAIRSGLVVGKYSWWPAWLLEIVTEQALTGTLDAKTIAALDQCAYAELSPAQARVARQLLGRDEQLIDTSAQRLEGLGEHKAAAKLRDGDLTAVALAARLIPL